MGYTRTYKIENLNFNGVRCRATLYDAYSFVPGFTIANPKLITGAGQPITISTVDTSEDKFSPIRAKRCTLRFNSDNSFNLNMFLEGEDSRWAVDVKAGDWEIFTGFLVADDCREAYQPHPNVVTLTANDNLGLLKEIPLTDFEGKNPKGKFPIIQYIAWALSKTGLKLPIRLVHNLVEESSADNSPCFKDNYLDAKTFEGQTIGTSINCYDVLTRILGYDCYLQQRNGVWWIMRVDEMETGIIYPHLFDWQGNYIESENPVNIDYQVGRNRVSHFVNADQEVTGVRKHKFDKLTYNYNFPKEIVDNIDFSRGQWITPVIVPDRTVEGNVYTGNAHTIEDWTTGNFAGTPGGAPAYIIKYYFEGYERERFVSINPRTSTSQPVTFIKSNGIDMHYRDRFTFSVDWRLSINMTGGSGTYRTALAIVELVGDDGKKYYLSNSEPEVGKWKVNSTLAGSERLFHEWNATQFDENNWQTLTVDADPLPVSGIITIYLQQSSLNADAAQTHYTNLRLSYDPYINGGYGDFEGHSNTVSEAGEYKANIDDEVFLGDSPKKLFKGAIFKQVGDKYTLVGNYYNAAVFRTRPDYEYFHPYGYTQVYAVHNQYNRTFRIITGSVQNLNAVEGDKMPDSMRVYTIAEEGAHAEGRKFMLANFTQNLRLEEWQATFIEVYSNAGKDYSAKHEFKYV